MSSWKSEMIKCSQLDVDEEYIIYGLNALRDAFFISVSLLVLGIIGDCVFETVLFLVISFLGTGIMGGYHCKTRFRCMMLTWGLWFLSVVASGIIMRFVRIPVMIPTFVLCIHEVVCFAPIEHPNKPLDERTRKDNRTKSIVLNIVLCIGIILLSTVNKKIMCVCWMLYMELMISFWIGREVNRNHKNVHSDIGR